MLSTYDFGWLVGTSVFFLGVLLGLALGMMLGYQFGRDSKL
jgi:hypothetical protein